VRSASSHEPLTSHPPLEMWGGVECTVNRVGDRYFDQTARTGHMSRLDDFDRFAELGIRTLRFPLLWERVQPECNSEPDWRWPDLALERVRELGLRPIVGLLHHGFGPRWVDVRAPEFAQRFACYARMVAERYPWIDAYTPINEPLTTARFSGLYGHWYPHGRDGATFAHLFLAQLTATSRAMGEIRRVNAGAELVQTEDLGSVASTPALEPQRNFENERRWLTWDALTGRLTPHHRCWSYLSGQSENVRELAALAEMPCAPDVIGVNHYITSERFLDERVEYYGLEEIGGNGRETYADVAQVQVRSVERPGIGALLREAWERYGIPIAVTECHIGCTREEQMRWLHEVWQAGVGARSDGIDVRAVTSWALLGSHDWNSLVTRESDHYECGAFDARGSMPRPTALAHMVRALALDGGYEHPVLESPGWWHRIGGDEVRGRPILIASSAGTTGRALVAACENRGLAHVVVDAQFMDAAAQESVVRALDAHQPWAVISAQCDAVALTEECSRRGLSFVACGSERDAHVTLDLLLDADCSASLASLGSEYA
jgi:dTDP-4-dehydrorhamnose reductase